MPIPAHIDKVLTNRERTIALLLLQGYSPRGIAIKAGISPKTVDVHLTKMRFKCNVRSTVVLAAVLAGVEQPRATQLPMTPQQKRIWELKKAGIHDNVIATFLGIQYNTVKIHVQRIRARLGIPQNVKTFDFVREPHGEEKR